MKANDHCNDWNLQLYWNNLEWLDPEKKKQQEEYIILFDSQALH